MKVSLGKNYKKIFTLEDLQSAKKVIQMLKEDEYTPADYLRMATVDILRGESDWVDSVISAEAETAPNYRAWNAYGENSGCVDVWIRGVVKCYTQILEIGVYLTDIWRIDGINTDVSDNSFVVRYVRK